MIRSLCSLIYVPTDDRNECSSFIEEVDSDGFELGDGEVEDDGTVGSAIGVFVVGPSIDVSKNEVLGVEDDEDGNSELDALGVFVVAPSGVNVSKNEPLGVEAGDEEGDVDGDGKADGDGDDKGDEEADDDEINLSAYSSVASPTKLYNASESSRLTRLPLSIPYHIAFLTSSGPICILYARKIR
jgi:hypothetical protein